MHLSGELARSLLEAAPEPLVAVDAGGRILFASHHVRSVFGYAPQRLIGQRVERLLAARCRDTHRAHRRRLLCDAEPGPEPVAETLQLHGRHQRGGEFPLEVSSTPVHGPQGTLVLMSFRDTSAECALAHRLALARQAGHRLPEAASHELRQPLQALSLLTAAAARQAAADPALAPIVARQREVLETLTRLLGSVLDTGKREPRRVEAPSPSTRGSARTSDEEFSRPARADAGGSDAERSDAATLGGGQRRKRR